MTLSDMDGDNATARRKKLFLYAKRIGLSRQDRIDLGEYVLRTDVSSWKDLDDEQVKRLLDALEGYLLVSYLLSEQVAHGSIAE